MGIVLGLGTDPFNPADLTTKGAVDAKKLAGALNAISNDCLAFQQSLKAVGESGYLIQTATPTDKTPTGVDVILPDAAQGRRRK